MEGTYNEILGKFKQEALSIILKADEMSINYPGFYNIVNRLFLEKEVLITNNAELGDHFDSFDFISTEYLGDLVKLRLDIKKFQECTYLSRVREERLILLKAKIESLAKEMDTYNNEVIALS